MNYENSRPIGVVASDSGHKAKYGNKDNSTVFMTFEELKRTWTYESIERMILRMIARVIRAWINMTKRID